MPESASTGRTEPAASILSVDSISKKKGGKIRVTSSLRIRGVIRILRQYTVTGLDMVPYYLNTIAMKSFFLGSMDVNSGEEDGGSSIRISNRKSDW